MSSTVFLFMMIAFVIFFATGILYDRARRHRFAKMTIVQEGKEYPNNHHVFGVGYYHAANRCWWVHPWNEFRERHGYYWDGVWHAEPDQRQCASSAPDPAEITRVNELWRKADPDQMQRFWKDVDEFGFGIATSRREGS
jgi:hypothetical protein